MISMEILENMLCMLRRLLIILLGCMMVGLILIGGIRYMWNRSKLGKVRLYIRFLALMDGFCICLVSMGRLLLKIYPRLVLVFLLFWRIKLLERKRNWNCLQAGFQYLKLMNTHISLMLGSAFYKRIENVNQ